MGDSFTLGKGAKGSPADPPPKHAAPRRVGGSDSFGRSRLVWGVIIGAVALVAVGGFLKFMGNAGQEIGADNQKVVEQVGAAQDVQAELTANESIRNAMQIYAASGSFTDVTAEALAAAEPTFHYVAGASGDPNTVSVAVADKGVGLAVESSSGSCLYAFVQASSTTYGTGVTCTGEAATGATDPSWPSG
jgi:hypothetical protein